MKKSRLLILLAGVTLGLVAVCWSRPQTASQRLRVLDEKGAEIHTLMGDQYNALVDHLEATGQTNALELFRQYRCSYNSDLSSSKLGDIVAALQHLHEGHTNEAIQALQQQLGFYASIMCNSYGCLNRTNRERVKLESLEKARNYYARFVPGESGGTLEKAMNEVLRLSSEKPK